MFSNHLYDLFCQMTQEHKSLWRIKNMYKKDAKGCKECQAFWKKIEKEKENHIKELERIIKNHIK